MVRMGVKVTLHSIIINEQAMRIGLYVKTARNGKLTQLKREIIEAK